MSESRREEAQSQGADPESTMARLVVSGLMMVTVLAAVAVVAVVARALAPNSGSLDGSPLAGFVAGSATAVASGARLLRRRQTRQGSKASSNAREGSDAFATMGPPVGVLFFLAVVMNWWEPSRAVAGIAAAAATGAFMVSLLAALALTRIELRPLWLPVVATPAWLRRLRSNVVAVSVACGFLIVASIPVVGAAFDADPLGSSAVVQLWIAVAIVAFGTGAVALRIGQDRALSVRLTTLRILASLASAGIGLSFSVDNNQLALVVVAVVGLVAILADLEAVRAFDEALRSPEEFSSSEPSHAAILAKLAILVLSLIFATFGGPGDAPGNRELAFVVVLVTVLEFTVVDLVLRPLLVEQGPAFHRLARPWRAAWHGYTRAASTPQSSTTDTGGVGKIIEDLVRQEFRFLSGQTGTAQSDTPTVSDVFLGGVPASEQASIYRARLVSAGLHIEGGEPQVQQVVDVQGRNPLRARIVVEYPSQRLVDETGRLHGRRAATRRSGMVWLVPSPSAGYRIADAVSQGNEPLSPLNLTAELTIEGPKRRELHGDPRSKMEERSG